MHKLAEMLRVYRASHQLTQRTLAAEIGIGAGSLSRIENSQGVDTATLLRLLAWATGMDLAPVSVDEGATGNGKAAPAALPLPATTSATNEAYGPKLADPRPPGLVSSQQFLEHVRAGRYSDVGEEWNAPSRADGPIDEPLPFISAVAESATRESWPLPAVVMDDDPWADEYDDPAPVQAEAVAA